MSDLAISVRNVSKCYRVFDNQRSRLLHALWSGHTKGMQEVWALKDINFEIKRGEAVAIIGRNGSGKSTLLEILTGTLTPTSGQVEVHGRVSALLELGSGFNPEYSGRDNVILNGLLLGLRREEILERFGEIEAFADIGAAIDRPVKTYSSGMMMRLAFAVQVLCDPDILIIDEALSVGDFFFQQKCLSYIRELCAKGVTLLFVSHDMGTVRDICNRGICMTKGVVVFDGDNLEAIRRYLHLNDNSTPPVELPPAASSEQPASTNNGQHLWALADGVAKDHTHIRSVGVFDELGNPVHSVKMGSTVRVLIEFQAMQDEKFHVYFGVKNKYNQLLTGVGSYSLRMSPIHLNAMQRGIFELTVKLLIEAGEYSFLVSLGKVSENGISGLIIDEKTCIGPFAIQWDYLKETPPFYGLVGMESYGKFLEVGLDRLHSRVSDQN
jgi:lipopolysaccharide transport system ATP-binding protein